MVQISMTVDCRSAKFWGKVQLEVETRCKSGVGSMQRCVVTRTGCINNWAASRSGFPDRFEQQSAAVSMQGSRYYEYIY